MKIQRAIKFAWLPALVLSVSYIFLMYNICPFIVSYDECGMRTIASGELAGEPGAHLLFVNYALGSLIRQLYLMTAEVQWYDLFLLASMAFGFWAFFLRVIGLCEGRKIGGALAFIAAAVGGFVALMYPMTANIRFTYAAAICGSALIFCLFTSEEYGWREYVISAVLIALCAGIRFSVFELVLPFLGLAALFRLVRSRRVRELWLYGVFIAIITALVAINGGSYTGMYTDEDRITRLRAEIQDYGGSPPYRENRGFYDTLFEDEREGKLLAYGFWGFSENLDVEVLEKLKEYKEGLDSSEARDPGVEISEALEIMMEDLPDAVWWMILGAAAVCLIHSFVMRRPVSCLGFILLGLAEMLYLIILGRFIFRAYYPVIVVTLCSIAADSIGADIQAEAGEEDGTRGRGVYSVAAAVVILCLSLAGFLECVPLIRSRYQEHQDVFALQERVAADTEHVYLYGIDGGFEEELALFRPRRANYTKYKGWITVTPEWKDFVYLGYDEIWDGLLFRDDLLFLTKAGNRQPKALMSCAPEKYGKIKLEHRSIFVGEREYWVWKVAVSGGDPLTPSARPEARNTPVG